MGKSDKKAKSDRINVLRKQYDAFLEEDKRRKERNENILEKIDKMRVCDKVVPYRAKVHYKSEINSSIPYNRYTNVLQPNKDQVMQAQSTFHTLCTPMQIDEALLKEISKTYILIPKQRQSDLTSIPKQIETEQLITNDLDWKSKYDILNKIKQSGKENLSQLGLVQNAETVDNDKIVNQSHDCILRENTDVERKLQLGEYVNINFLQVPETPSTVSESNSKISVYSNDVPPSIESKTIEHVQEPSLVEMKHGKDYENHYNFDESNKEKSLYMAKMAQNEGYVDKNPSNFQESNEVNLYYGEFGNIPENVTVNQQIPYVEGDVYNQLEPHQDEQYAYNEAEPSSNDAVKDNSFERNVNNEANPVIDNYSEEVAQNYQFNVNHTSEVNENIHSTSSENNLNTNDNETQLLNAKIARENAVENPTQPHETFGVSGEQAESKVEYRTENVSQSDIKADNRSDNVVDTFNVIDPSLEENQRQPFVGATLDSEHEAAIAQYETDDKRLFNADLDFQTHYDQGEDYNQLQEHQDENYLQDEQYNAHYDTVLTDSVYTVEVDDDQQVVSQYDQSYEQQYVPEYGLGDGQQPYQYDDQQQPYDVDQYVSGNQPVQVQPHFESQDHYEPQQYEVQQSAEPQSLVTDSQYDQTQIVAPQVTPEIVDEQIDSKQTIEQQLDKEDGLPLANTLKSKLRLKAV